MIDYIVSAGPAGIAVAIATAVLLVTGASMIVLSCTRKAFALYALLIWVPLLLGSLGTRAALKEMDRSPIIHADAIGPRNQKKLRTQLHRPLNLGIGATVLLLPLAAVGLVTGRKRGQNLKDDGPQQANQV